MTDKAEDPRTTRARLSGPEHVTKNATVSKMGPGGVLTVLLRGTNVCRNAVCLPPRVRNSLGRKRIPRRKTKLAGQWNTPGQKRAHPDVLHYSLLPRHDAGGMGTSSRRRRAWLSVPLSNWQANHQGRHHVRRSDPYDGRLSKCLFATGFLAAVGSTFRISLLIWHDDSQAQHAQVSVQSY